MRRLVAALFAALLALTLVGCGGGEPAEEPANNAAEAPAPAPAAAPADGEAAAIANRSDLYGEVFEAFPPEDVTIPAAVNERLASGQAMLILFYNSSQDVTNDLRRQVNAVIDDNKGAIDLITYDLSESTKVAADGTIVVDKDALQADGAGKEAVSFARSIGVDHAPYIVIVDDRGYQIFWSAGFIDAELLDRQVQRATD